MAKTAWPPIRADREMADDERGETFTSAGRRRALPGTSDASLDPKTRGGRADGDAQNQNAADVASGSGERAGTGVVDEGNVSFAETRKAKTDAFADAPARDPRAAAAAAAAARFEASRLARDAAGAG
jgi:hypothetical protein